MRTRENILNIVLVCLLLCLGTQPVFAQPKGIAEILEEKSQKGSGMQSRSFKKPKPVREETEKTPESEDYTELSPEKDVPEKKSVRPEEDVWEKYKSIAQGRESKKLEVRSYKLGGATKEEEEEEDDVPDENTIKKEEEAPPQQKKTKKEEPEAGGIAKILDDYKNRNKSGIRSRTVNN